jgi:hypothetical protein
MFAFRKWLPPKRLKAFFCKSRTSIISSIFSYRSISITLYKSKLIVHSSIKLTHRCTWRIVALKEGSIFNNTEKKILTVQILYRANIKNNIEIKRFTILNAHMMDYDWFGKLGYYCLEDNCRSLTRPSMTVAFWWKYQKKGCNSYFMFLLYVPRIGIFTTFVILKKIVLLFVSGFFF